MSDIDWDELEREMDRMMEKWRSANLIFKPGASEESGFGYGFELGWRLAKGEVIE